MATTGSTFEDFLAWVQDSRACGQVHFDDKQRCWQVLGHPEATGILSDPGRFSSDLSALLPDQEDFALFPARQLRPDGPATAPQAAHSCQPGIHAEGRCWPRPAHCRVDHTAARSGRRAVRPDRRAGLPAAGDRDRRAAGHPSHRAGAVPVVGRCAVRSGARPDQAVTEVGEQTLAAVTPTMREMNAYFLDYISSRRANPGDDLTSNLVRAEVDGERLVDEEIVGFVGLLLLAGHITTTATLGNSVVTFQENPAALAEIRADPTLLPAAIEEVLRVRTPFPRLARLTTVDAEVGGVSIPAGQIVVPWLIAANRDERVFADPHRFDIHRKPNPHLAFGHGIHFCLGAPLARLEARCALRLLLRRFRDIEVPGDERVEHRSPWTMVAVTRLPLTVRAA